MFQQTTLESLFTTNTDGEGGAKIKSKIKTKVGSKTKVTFRKPKGKKDKKIIKLKIKKKSSTTKPLTTKPLTKLETDYVFTDGSTFNNGKPNAVGGIGIFFGNRDRRNVSEPFLLKPITNNRCEIFAVIKAIENYSQSLNIRHPKFQKHNLIIYCDSMYTIDLITKWIHKWKRNGWKTANGKDVKNKDLIVWMDNLITINKHYFQVSFEHAKAHSKEPKDKSGYKYFLWYGNMMADKYAVNGSKLSQKAQATRQARAHRM
jgi:ribonuclease HI